MPKPTLHRSKSLWSDPKAQRDHLSNGIFSDQGLPTFRSKIKENGFDTLTPKPLEILQVNVGYKCNQTCTHCHVDAGPDRKEVMTKETMEHIIEVLKHHPIKSLDITGGAPEMHPAFRWFVQTARPHVDEIIVRSNLTIFSANKNYYDLPQFLAEQQVRVISSLPCYTKENTDRQRGTGVFDRSIDALRQLNDLGYGKKDTGLMLDLVYNPQGTSLPGPQEGLERDYKRELAEQFGIVFNQLFCITNLPISRFLDSLIRDGKYEEYMQKLVDAYNPFTLDEVMCRNTLSISWDGRLYDCDFNQMLLLDTEVGAPNHIKDFDWEAIQNRNIAIGQHCYGCTAGAGSSCQGSLV